MITSVLVGYKSSTFDDHMRKNDIYILVLSDLDLTFLSKICSDITRVQRYVSPKLKVCTSLPFRINQKHESDTRQTDRQTDGRTNGQVQRLVRPLGGLQNK